MKNYFYTSLLFLIISTTAHAQLQQGSLFLSGSLSIQAINQDGASGFSSSTLFFSSSDVSTTNVEVAPSLGYLFSSNLAGGLELSYAHSNTKVEQVTSSSFFLQTQESSARLFTIRPFVRYYKPFGERLGFQLDIAGGIGFGKSKADRVVNAGLIEVEENLSTFELGLSPGFYYFVSPRFMVDASVGGIGYELEKSNPVEPEGVSRQSSRFYTLLDSGIGLRLGVNYFFLSGGQ